MRCDSVRFGPPRVILARSVVEMPFGGGFEEIVNGIFVIGIERVGVDDDVSALVVVVVGDRVAVDLAKTGHDDGYRWWHGG